VMRGMVGNGFKEMRSGTFFITKKGVETIEKIG